MGRNGVLARGIFGFPLDGSVLQYRDEAWCQGRPVAVGLFVQPEFEWVEVARMLQILFFPQQRGIGFDKPPVRLLYFAFEQIRVDRAFIDIKERNEE